MLGVIVCDYNSFILKTINNKTYLSYWYDTLYINCSKIIIIINEKYKNMIIDILGDNINVSSNINIIKNEDYNLCIYINHNNTILDINNTSIQINTSLNDDVLNYNGVLIFKKNIENTFIENQNLLIEDNLSISLCDCSNFNNINRCYIKGTIIIVSLYLGNINQENIDMSLKCLKSMREYYKKETIIIVDNNSINKDWIKTANELNMYILTNTNELFRYEIGAYNLALKYFKADAYICIHHNIQFYNKIAEELENDKPDVYLFDSIIEYDDKAYQWKIDLLEILNPYLKFLNMGNFTCGPLTKWNCFYCNNLMMEELLKSGLFNLISNNKRISGAQERILGVFFNKITGNTLKIINSNTFLKTSFLQL
jgi:hypothetical protein